MRIFPGLFDIVPLGAEGPNADPANVIGITHAGLIADGGPWGRICLDFLFSRRVADIYKGPTGWTRSSTIPRIESPPSPRADRTSFSRSIVYHV